MFTAKKLPIIITLPKTTIKHGGNSKITSHYIMESGKRELTTSRNRWRTQTGFLWS